MSAPSYIPLTIAEGTAIAEPDYGPGGIISMFGELVYAQVRITETVQVRRPTDEEQQFPPATGRPARHRDLACRLDRQGPGRRGLRPRGARLPMDPGLRMAHRRRITWATLSVHVPPIRASLRVIRTARKYSNPLVQPGTRRHIQGHCRVCDLVKAQVVGRYLLIHTEEVSQAMAWIKPAGRAEAGCQGSYRDLRKRQRWAGDVAKVPWALSGRSDP